MNESPNSRCAAGDRDWNGNFHYGFYCSVGDYCETLPVIGFCFVAPVARMNPAAPVVGTVLLPNPDDAFSFDAPNDKVYL